MLDFHQLRCFVAVAEELHFTRAAERLHMTQPPLSRQIQLLEHSVNASLFDRNNRVVRLTPAGRSLLPEARMILKLVENASLSTQRVSRGEAGIVSIGFTAAAGYEFLPDAIGDWRARSPDVELRLKEMVSGAQLDALEAGRLDFGLLRPPVTREGLCSACVVREPLVAALPAAHPLTQTKRLQIGDFDQQSVVMFAPDEARYFYDLAVHIFSRAGVAPRYAQYVSQVHSVLSLVRAGLGMALVPQAARSLRYHGIEFRDLSDLTPARPVELHLVWKSSNDNPVLPHLLDAISSRLSQPAPRTEGAG